MSIPPFKSKALCLSVRQHIGHGERHNPLKYYNFRSSPKQLLIPERSGIQTYWNS